MKTKKETTKKVKEILIDVLNLDLTIEQIRDDHPLFGTDNDPGLFDDSLAVLEVTSVLMAEFDIDASIFDESSFQSIDKLSHSIYEAQQIEVSQ